MIKSDGVKEILGELVEMENQKSLNLSTWYDLAEEIYKYDKASTKNIPEIVWHYLSDADIRQKEESYGIEQIKAVKEFLSNGDADDT